ncbi:MAG: hypothetical protein N2235_21190 [Fischerella sp.]|nr:hypothetical protein [Fischerella sp.]
MKIKEISFYQVSPHMLKKLKQSLKLWHEFTNIISFSEARNLDEVKRYLLHNSVLEPESQEDILRILAEGKPSKLSFEFAYSHCLHCYLSAGYQGDKYEVIPPEDPAKRLLWQYKD